MQLTNPKTLLPIIAGVSLAIASVAWRASHSEAPGTYKTGDRFPAPAASQHTSVEHLVLFIDSRCAFCQASVPLYRQMFGSRPTQRRGMPVIVVGTEELGRLDGFLKGNGLNPSEVFSLKLDQYAFRYTPTLLRVSPAGIIREVWIGKVPKDEERRILELMATNN